MEDKTYPETYTMGFGNKEIYAVDKITGNPCTRDSCEFHDGKMMQNCSYFNPEGCKYAKLVPLSVTFELTKECPECQGKGDHYVFDDGVHHPCPHCSNNGLPKGKVPRYWTPDEAAKEIKAMTGTDWEWPDDTLIRHLLKNSRAWHSSLLRNIHDWVPKVLAFPGQPAPPDNWRPGGDIKELTNG
jgi:hypothetical protein